MFGFGDLFHRRPNGVPGTRGLTTAVRVCARADIDKRRSRDRTRTSLNVHGAGATGANGQIEACQRVHHVQIGHTEAGAGNRLKRLCGAERRRGSFIKVQPVIAVILDIGVGARRQSVGADQAPAQQCKTFQHTLLLQTLVDVSQRWAANGADHRKHHRDTGYRRWPTVCVVPLQNER